MFELPSFLGLWAFDLSRPCDGCLDLGGFIQLVLDEFAALHSSNAVCFGLRPFELAAWLEKQGGAA
jgi:hypothetical protein